MFKKHFFEIIESDYVDEGYIYFDDYMNNFNYVGDINTLFIVKDNFIIPLGIAIYLGEDEFEDIKDFNENFSDTVESFWDDDDLIESYNDFVSVQDNNTKNYYIIGLAEDCELGKKDEIVIVPEDIIIEETLDTFSIKIETEIEGIFRCICFTGELIDIMEE